MTVSTGTRLGPYEMLSPLGAGGMGEVYRARDTRLQREVAVKVLPAELSSDAARLKRFEREARSASALNHPNIVTIHEVGQSDSTSFIVMELVDGKTLRELLYAGPLPLRKLLSIAAQVADGLAKAHASGIVHRDLKPENVMVTGDGFAKILDFGLAKLTHPDSDSGQTEQAPTIPGGTEPGVVMGTVGYMSPEQAAGQRVEFRSDQFSLGSILYEMATGKRAFERATRPETLVAIIREEPEPIAALNSKAPSQLRWIVERCLAKDPRERYGSTQDLARDLLLMRDHLSEATVSGEALVAAPSRRLWLRRLAALATIAVAVLGGYLLSERLGRGTPVSSLRFHQLTSRSGAIWTARFAPDGQTVVYDARSEGKPTDILSMRPGSPESRSLGLPPANILSISSSGELAVSLPSSQLAYSHVVDRDFRIVGGTLARVPLGGGAPREVLEDVFAADWAPDGKTLAAAANVGGKFRLEFPIGRAIYEAPGPFHRARVSPKGNLVAILSWRWDIGEIVVVDPRGNIRRTRAVRGSSPGTGGLAWSPNGKEIWFSTVSVGITEIRAMNMSGRERLIASLPGHFLLHDISEDGRVLVARATVSSEVFGLFPGEARERNLSFLDRSFAGDLSADGKTLLFGELGAGAGEGPGVYIRKTDGSPAKRLGEGRPAALSPDGNWALTLRLTSPPQLVLLPTGPGQPRPLPQGGVRVGGGVSFTADGKRVFFQGREPGRGGRGYWQDLDGGKPRPATPEGTSRGLPSPDGSFVSAWASDGNPYLYPAEGGADSQPLRISGIAPGEEWLEKRWSADGRSIFVRGPYEAVPGGSTSAKIYRLDPWSGRRELWKEIVSAHPTGIRLAADGKSYVYTDLRLSSELFVVEGLR